MLKLDSNRLVFEFPEVHPDAKLTIEFQRTLRIPDDGKEYPLPPGFGTFPVRLVDDFDKRVPKDWVERGGVMLPMSQAEAMWIRFVPNAVYRQGTQGYPMAVRVSAGKVNAVSGEPWRKKLHKGDYMVVPPQPWLDGFCVKKGKIRQFVAMPLGMGMTVEQQVTGDEEHGGVQIEVYPMKAEEFERRFPKPPPVEIKTSGMLRSSARKCSFGGAGGQSASFSTTSHLGAATMDCCVVDQAQTVSADMGLGAGGLMTQQIYEDAFGKDVWTKKRRKCFVHLANSFAWEVITREAPPPTPCTAEAYAARGYPWFEHYLDGVPIHKGGKNLKAIKTVMELGFQKGITVLPENRPAKVKKSRVIQQAGSVRNGSW
jgi:hypothetical protein